MCRKKAVSLRDFWTKKDKTMKVTRTVNVNGVVFHIDNDAYQALNDYLQDIELRLSADDREKEMAAIEARVCELLQAELFARNVQVVDIKMVDAITQRIGQPADFGANKRPHIKYSAARANSGCGRVFGIALLVFLILVALPILIPLFAGLFALLIGVFGVGMGSLSLMPIASVPFLVGAEWWQILLGIIAIIVAIATPVFVIVRAIVTFLRTRHLPKARFWLISLLCWGASLVCLTVLTLNQAKNLGGIDVLLQQIDNEDTPAALTAEVPAFNAINISGAMDVDILQGDTLAIAVNDSMLVDYQVKDSVLTISGNNINGYRHANITVRDLAAINISGASTVSLRGQYNDLQISLSGASKLDAEKADVTAMHINCLGASKAEVNVTKELWAQASGASKITYKGHPTLKRNMAVGASKIIHD